VAAFTFVVLNLVTGEKYWLPWVAVAAMVMLIPKMYFYFKQMRREHEEWKLERAKELGLEPGDPRVSEASMVDPIDWSKVFRQKRERR
jgi:hypothetical protein